MGMLSWQELAQREGLERGQIYKWRVQLERRDRLERIETIADTEGVSIEQARKIRELEDELAATQQKLAQTLLENDLLKKLQPSSPFAKWVHRHQARLGSVQRACQMIGLSPSTYYANPRRARARGR